MGTLQNESFLLTFRDRLRFPVHRHGRRRAVTGLGIAIHVVNDRQRTTHAVDEALAAALAILRVGDYGLVGLFVKTEYIHRADLHTALAADALVQIVSGNTHF